MTTPTVLSLLTPPTVPGPGKDAGTGSGKGAASGHGAAEEFAALVAGLIAGVLGGRPAPTNDAAAGSEDAPADSGSDAQDLTEADATTAAAAPGSAAAGIAAAGIAAAGIAATGIALAATTVPDIAAIACAPQLANMGRVSAPSSTADRAETGPKMAVSEAPGSPTTAHSGGAVGLSSPADTPAAQPESGPQPGPNEQKFSSHGKERSAEAHATNEARQLARVGGPVPVSEVPDGRGARQKTDAPAAPPPEGPAVGVPPVTAPMAPVATTSVDAPAPAAPPAPAATAAQLVEPVVAVHRRGPDGTHSMTVDITPEELGPVRVHVELREGNVELRLAGHSEAARDALRAALPELRRALEAAGVGTGSFQISPDSPPFSDRSPNQGNQQQPQFGAGADARNPNGSNPQNGHARPAWAGTGGRVPSPPEPAPAVAGPAGTLDVQL